MPVSRGWLIRFIVSFKNLGRFYTLSTVSFFTQRASERQKKDAVSIVSANFTPTFNILVLSLF
ncbi:hypothetical protein BCY91_02795 [Pelobium manganitolerans]|uniref:Uncharacterized protein n=1 Tax=Pelobium manganitolerans TaxID=1842495 RepID=A0A419S759_9SPHI|nr:hypothetical protein BCY91_02795 [Pelobium manganitolerans]